MGGIRLRGLGLTFNNEKIYGEVFIIEDVDFIYHADTKTMIKVQPDTIKYMVEDTVGGEELYVGDIIGTDEQKFRVDSFLNKTLLRAIDVGDERNSIWFNDLVGRIESHIKILERVYESSNTY